MSWTLRAASVEDAEAIVRLDAALAAEPGIHLPFAPDEVRTVDQQRQRLQGLLDGDQLDLVAVVDGEIVGELCLQRWTKLRAGAHVRILGISIARPWRGRGLGRALMEEAIAWARSRPDISRIELSVYTENAPAIALYRRFGFEIEGTRRQLVKRDGGWIDDHVMALLLRQ